MFAVAVLILVGAQGGGGNRNISAQTAAPAVDLAAMRSVIRQDNDLSTEVNAAIGKGGINTDEDLDRVAALIRNYVAAARQIDINSCPRDFAESYYRHLSAWSDQAEAVSSHPHIPSEDEALIEGFFRGLNGDITGGVIQRQDELNQWLGQVKARDADIHRTWKK